MMTLLNRETPHAHGAEGIRAVIFDWAGTTVDFGSLAPVRTLERIFGEAGVPIEEEEARREMGIAKRDHIAVPPAMPRIRSEWARVRGREALPIDIEVLYERFLPLQLACLSQYSRVIPGVVEAVAELRSKGIKIGSTTGYTRAMLDVLAAEAAREGYKPDCIVSPEEVGFGRPHPFMIYAAAIKLQVSPMAAIVKVGDTPADIREGLNAGVWCVGVAGTGVHIGLSEAHLQALTADERKRKIQDGKDELQAAGAHSVVGTLGELGAVVNEIEALLAGKQTAA